MAPIADERLDAIARVVPAKKVTPAAIRVVDVQGTGPQLLGNLRQVDALLVVLDGFSGTRAPADDLETLRLELLVAARDPVERRPRPGRDGPPRGPPPPPPRAPPAAGGASGGPPPRGGAAPGGPRGAAPGVAKEGPRRSGRVLS